MARYKHKLTECLCRDMKGAEVRRGDFVLFPYVNKMILGVVKGKSKIKDFDVIVVEKLVGRYGHANTSVSPDILFKIRYNDAVIMLTKAKLENYNSVRAEGLKYLESIERQREYESRRVSDV